MCNFAINENYGLLPTLELVDRGKKLQRRMKSRFKPKKKRLKVVMTWQSEKMMKCRYRLELECKYCYCMLQISFCKMKLSSRGLYVRDSSYFEVPLCKSDYYSDVIEKVSDYLDLEGESYLLLCASGSVISDQDIKVGKKMCTWRLGSYMNHLSVN